MQGLRSVIAKCIDIFSFDKKRGLAVSLALMGSGFSGVILSPVINRIISIKEWRTAFLASPVMVVNEFGKKDLELLVGRVTAFEMLGAAIAAPLTGVAANKYGTYASAWIILIIIGALMLITLIVSVIKARKLVAGLESAEPAPIQ